MDIDYLQLSHAKRRLRELGYPADNMRICLQLEGGPNDGLAFYGDLHSKHLAKLARRLYAPAREFDLALDPGPGRKMTGYQRVSALRQHRCLVLILEHFKKDSALWMSMHQQDGSRPEHALDNLCILPGLMPDEMLTRIMATAPHLVGSIKVATVWQRFITDVNQDANLAAQALFFELMEAKRHPGLIEHLA